MVIQWEHIHYEYDYENRKWINEVEEEEEEFFEEEEEEEHQLMLQQFIGNTRAIAVTPFGSFDINDAFSPLKGFELWLGYTDFSITQEIAQRIEKVEGVELFSLMTRYRFCVGIGKLFSFRDVRRGIEATLNINIEDTLPKAVLELKESLEQQTDDWLIYVGPNGDYLSSNSFQSNHRDVVNLVLNSKEYENGIILKGKYLSE